MGTAMVEAGALVVAAWDGYYWGCCSCCLVQSASEGVQDPVRGMAVLWYGMVRHGIAGMSGAVFHVAAAALLLTASAGRNQAGSCRDGGLVQCCKAITCMVRY